jgi:hypothetical protein
LDCIPQEACLLLKELGVVIFTQDIYVAIVFTERHTEATVFAKNVQAQSHKA